MAAKSNKKIKPLTTEQATKKVSTLMGSIEDGIWVGLRDFFAELRRQENEGGGGIRAACVSTVSDNWKKQNGKPVPINVFDQWTDAEPDNPDAHLIRGNLLVVAAWNARTAHWGALVTEVQAAIFQKRLQEAAEACEAAVKLDPSDPLPYSTLLTVGMGMAKPKTELWDIFSRFQANSADPHNSSVHGTMLYTLTPKWGGSLEELFAFAKSSTLEATSAQPPPGGHPLWTLICRAHLYAWEDSQTSSATIVNGRLVVRSSGCQDEYWQDSNVQNDILRAYERYIDVDKETNNNYYYYKSDIKTAKACSNRFAFCLWKVGAYCEAKKEMDKIGNSPTEDPWNEESNANWKQIYINAKKVVAQRARTANPMILGIKQKKKQKNKYSQIPTGPTPFVSSPMEIGVV